MPYHPVFNVERFTAHASQDSFFLAIEAVDPKFDRHATRAFLQSLGAKEVNDVEDKRRPSEAPAKRLRPERSAGGKRAAGTPPSEREWGWGPTSRDKCRPSRSRASCSGDLSVVASACRQDMHDQPKYRGLRPSVFFADGASARPRVEGTVARGTLQEDEAFFTGQDRQGRP